VNEATSQSQGQRHALAFGSVRPGFEHVRTVFEARLQKTPDWGGAFAAYVNGELVVDLWGGETYAADSLQCGYSSTKGAASLCLALLQEHRELDPNRCVADYWPEFAAAGKRNIPVRWLVSHQAGLAAVEGGFTLDEYIEHTQLAHRLALQAPLWPPGKTHGYHPLTWGTLVDELVRRVTGEPLGAFYEREIRCPNGIEFYLGLPESQDGRVVHSRAQGRADDSRNSPNPQLLRAALNLDTGFPEPKAMELDRKVRAAALPAVSGIGSARGLARLYATCIDEVGHGPLLSADTTAAVATPQTSGPDWILPFETSFGLGFQTPSTRMPLAGPGSFGHDGFAGSLGFASPNHSRLAIGFFTDHVPKPDGGADAITQDLTRALISVCGRLGSSHRNCGPDEAQC